MHALYTGRNAVTGFYRRQVGAALAATCISAALLAQMAMPAGAAYAASSAGNTKKSQVVYVKTADDGQAQGVYVVNRFDDAQGATITDAGKYQSTVNLSGVQQLSNSNPSFTSETESYSYQGNLPTKTATPWTIEATYYLDGEKLSADEIAGASGHVKIALSISPDETCSGPYAENYLVQATASLDSENAWNVTSNSGTTAQAVGETQTTFMVMPGKSAVCEVETDVSDFEFDGWQIVGVPLSMAIEVDDSHFASATDSLKNLESATHELSEGATQVNSGAATVGDALDSLANTNGTLNEGVADYASAMSSLAAGAQQVDTAVSSLLLPGMQQLSAGSEQYQAGLNEQAQSFSQQAAAIDVDAAQASCRSATAFASETFAQVYAASFAQAYAPAFAQAYAEAIAAGSDQQTAMQQASALASQSAATQATSSTAASSEVASAQTQATQATEALVSAAAAKAGNQGAAQALSGASSSYDPLAQGIASVVDEGSSTGVAALAQATSQLSGGLDQASSSYGQLQQGVARYTQGVGTLASQYGTFQSGVSSLSSGASELATQTNGIDQKALEQVKDKLKDYLNPSFQQQDFVNGETDGIKTVQFVYQTGKVARADDADASTDDAAESAESQQTFLDKLAALFGL